MPDRRPRAFNEFLAEQGSTHDDLTEALATLVDKVVQIGAPGHLTLKITVRPAGKGDDLVLAVTDQITVKHPEPGRPQKIFFALPDGGIGRRDPRQLELDDVLRGNNVEVIKENDND